MNMTALIITHPAPSGSPGVTRQTERLWRKEARRHNRNDFRAALVLAGTVLSATTAPALLTSEAATPTPQKVACTDAGQRLAPWFRAEADRKALVGLEQRDDFNLLLTWFRNAQAQCASGQTARAVKNFRAVEAIVAGRAEQLAPEHQDE